MKYAHYLITRFNLPLKGWSKDKHNQTTATDEWLDERVELFKQYCLPSVVAQTSKNFIWLLLFYDKTPERYKRMNDELGKQFSFYQARYLNDQEAEECTAYINNFIQSTAPSDVDYVLTTRLDNDDSLAMDAMEELESSVLSKPKDGIYFLNLLHGIQFYPKYNVSVVLNWKCNHFTTLAEPKATRYNTALKYNHMKVSQSHPVVHIGRDKVMWMEVCHERNLVNDFHARWVLNPVKSGFEQHRFKVTPPYATITH